MSGAFEDLAVLPVCTAKVEVLRRDAEFLLINKPEGWTSFDAVALARKQLTANKLKSYKLQANGKLKVGHAGTLDPFATGLLIIGVGREATKKLDEFKKMPKTYVVTIKLGEVSDTYDKTGRITQQRNASVIPTESADEWRNPLHSEVKGSLGYARDDNTPPTLEKIKETINYFIGKQSQIPPMFSAKKINGRRLYELARKGIEVERKPNAIEIYAIKILDYTWPFLKIEVQCSTGTYIRSLAHDIGEKLGVGAYCEELVRTKIGGYSLDNATNINNL